MIYEVVEVLSQRPQEPAPIFDAVVETLGWDPLPRRAAEDDATEKPAKPDLVKRTLPDTSQPRPRIRKPRPRQGTESLVVRT
ncbi:hypothetical protein [Fodinicola acaciae]|uniref:hypothetical protein n=1 Tax=Fodinicola acaciae TaxID=2681555 RepID=UPI0013CF72F7|nr:hypothetical protein [Fodinicola acaciae]